MFRIETFDQVLGFVFQQKQSQEIGNLSSVLKKLVSPTGTNSKQTP